MKLTLADSTYLKDSITVISELVHEARFKLTKDGIELIAMDPANVAMVVFKLLSSAFTEYELENETEIAINLANFKQILRRAKAQDVVSLEAT
ncbi:DNA polymerase sliding clamp, partial [Candidatus Woesearchaeota archaeon]|nr:DNA polymerase sliding clamp [Candidatus Woesearchaeota archaeon]